MRISDWSSDVCSSDLPEPCSLAEIAGGALAMVAPQAKRAGVELTGPAGELPILADRRALTQILVNLLGNAVKLNRPGGSFSMSARVDTQYVTITVPANGVGITVWALCGATAAYHRKEHDHRSRS